MIRYPFMQDTLAQEMLTSHGGRISFDRRGTAYFVFDSRNDYRRFIEEWQNKKTALA